MKRFIAIYVILFVQASVMAQLRVPVQYYVDAFNEIAAMLSGEQPLSVKRAVFLAEWAYYEGKLDYKKDFCDEIDRIAQYVNSFYVANKLQAYKTGKQMALNEYFFRPYKGNNYNPYTYDYDNFSIDSVNWETQFVSKVLKTHRGQCRSLPWMYKIIANEIGADVAIANAPCHCYIMYHDLDNFTPEEWINLEMTSHQMLPAAWIKQHAEIRDSAIIVGTYMTPLTDKQIVACQLAGLACGYNKKFQWYDRFVYYCTRKALEYYPYNPIAILLYGNSLYQMRYEHLMSNGGCVDDRAIRIECEIYRTNQKLQNTYLTIETDSVRELRGRQAIEHKNFFNPK